MTEIDDIYHLYFDDVFKYIMTLCRNESIAEEITQETFFKALKSIDSYNGQCKIYVWLCQIAKNTYFSFYRKEKNTQSKRLIDPNEPANFELELVNKEEAYAVHQVLHNLDEPYKEVFSLRTFGELSFKNIGSLFDKSDVWARVTYHRAKLKIQEALL